MDRAIKRITLAILAMFLLLLINTNYLQAFEASSLTTEPQNIRAESSANQVERGSIETSDGVTVAGDKPAPASSALKYQRHYSNGPAYAPVTGFDTVYSATGVEKAEDQLLSGSGQQLALRNFLDMVTNKPQKGATVQLTINSKAQQAAYQGLSQILRGTSHIGGVVAMDPSTGAILAMASYPSYDPNELTTTNGTKLNKLVGAGGSLITASPSPLINNATSALLPPGSTFKIITSSAWFTQNSSRNASTNVSSPTVLTMPQTTAKLHNDQGEVCGNGSGQTTILWAFAQSCDTTFGNLGMTLGGSALNSMATKYGYNQSLDAPGLSPTTSSYAVPSSLPLTAFSAIGQFSDTATPLEEAMMASTVANNGALMKPYLVKQVTASDLSTVDSTTPSTLSNPVSPSTASNLQSMMKAVTQQPEGTGYQFNANNEGGLVIAGKTGTAQNQLNGVSAAPDSVFTSYAPANGTPKIAVGVMIQGAGYGATAAAPIAVNVIKAYLASVGQG